MKRPQITCSGAALREGRRGFTLIEVLIASAVLMLIVVMFTRMLSYVGGLWERGHCQQGHYADVRAIGDFMSREIQAALLPVIRSDQSSLQLVLNPTTVSSSAKSGDALFWQAPLADDQRLGDIAEIGYFVRWDTTTTPSNPSASLCRYFVNPVTRNSSPATADSNFLIYTQPTNWINDQLLNALTPANQSNNYAGLFVENVIGIWITCLDPTGKTITTDASGVAFSNNTFDSRRGYLYTGGTASACALPAAIDLSFVLLDDHSAKRVGPSQQAAIVALAASAKNADQFISLALANSTLAPIRTSMRPWTTRVYLQSSQ
jgi:prepilin-type N-terminal cleavage/methylation domain-containing protein